MKLPPVDSPESAVKVAIRGMGTVKRTLKWIGVAFAAFILYALSFGPCCDLRGQRLAADGLP